MYNKVLENYDVIFYRKGKDHYFIYNNNEFEVNQENIDKLSSLLKLPYIVKFYGLSKGQIGRTIRDLLNTEVDFKLYRVKKDNSKVKEYAASFYENKNTLVEVYKVPNSQVLLSRTSKTNPYMLTKFNNENVLMEVPKDYFRKNNGDYYFLPEDLTDTEKIVFKDCHTKIECEYVYNFSDYKYGKKKKNKQKVKKR